MVFVYCLTDTMNCTMLLRLLFSLVPVGVLGHVSWQSYFTPEHWSFISGVNLIFHEAGHVLFFFFGHFLYVLGGSFVELLIPTMVAGYFMLRGEWYSCAFGLWWLSTAFLSVGIYAADARERALPLITGDSTSHDWWYLLDTLNMLRYDTVVGGFFISLSVLSLVLAVVVFVLKMRMEIKKSSSLY